MVFIRAVMRHRASPEFYHVTQLRLYRRHRTTLVLGAGLFYTLFPPVQQSAIRFFRWIRLCSVGYGYFLWGMIFVTEVTELSGKGMKVVQK